MSKIIAFTFGANGNFELFTNRVKDASERGEFFRSRNTCLIPNSEVFKTNSPAYLSCPLE